MEGLKRPTLLISKRICVSNIAKMEEHARMNQVLFRPHFKTHQSVEIGNWFRSAGITSITVSSVSMAEFFAKHGWTDITIAFPVNLLEIDEINELSQRLNLNLLVDSPATARFLARNIQHTTGFFIEVDTGNKRTGVNPEDHHTIRNILDKASQSLNLRFSGFLTHTGQAYSATHTSEIMQFHMEAGNALTNLKEEYRSAYPGLILSTGDTPTCSLFDPYPGIDEIRPGNFVFYDLMQYYLGTCSLENISVALACPVVSVFSDRNEAVLYGGSVHLSKEQWTTPQGEKTFGMAVALTADGWDVNSSLGFLGGLSQEHGILRLQEGIQLSPGDLVAILPVHSCLAMDLMQNKEDGVRIID